MSVEVIPEFESLPESWDLRPLADLVSEDRKISYGIVQPGFHDDSGVPIIRVNNIRQNRIVADDVMRVSAEIESQYKRTRIQGGELLVTLVGSLGEVAIAGDTYRGWNLARAVGVVPIADPAIAEWVKFYLGSRIAKYFIGMWANTTVQHTLNLKDLAQLPVPLPPAGERQELIELIGSLDEKIELNRKQNRTLEAIAQALFKRWFVEFEFPDENGRPYKSSGGAMQPSDKSAGEPIWTAESRPEGVSAMDGANQLGEIPAGWEVKPLSELINLIGGGTPKTSVAEYWGGNIPWFSVVDAPNGSDTFVINTEKKVTQAGIDNSSTNLLRAGTTIVSARGTVGRLALVGVDMAMNQSCYGVQGRVKGTDFFTYLTLQRALGELRANAHGSVFDTITRATFEHLVVVRPDEYVILEFEKVIDPIFQKLLANVRQSVSLSKLRDTLLPKLMSGELRVGVAA